MSNRNNRRRGGGGNRGNNNNRRRGNQRNEEEDDNRTGPGPGTGAPRQVPPLPQMAAGMMEELAVMRRDDPNNFVDEFFRQMQTNGMELNALLNGGGGGADGMENGPLPTVAKAVKCPVCNREYSYVPAPMDDEHHLTTRLEERCSHHARTVFLSGHCVVCLEDQAGPPLVRCSDGFLYEGRVFQRAVLASPHKWASLGV